MNIEDREKIAEGRRDVLLGLLIIAAIGAVDNMSFIDCVNLGVC